MPVPNVRPMAQTCRIAPAVCWLARNLLLAMVSLRNQLPVLFERGAQLGILLDDLH